MRDDTTESAQATAALRAPDAVGGRGPTDAGFYGWRAQEPHPFNTKSNNKSSALAPRAEGTPRITVRILFRKERTSLNIREMSGTTNQPTGVEVLQTILHRPFAGLEPFAAWLKENTLNYLIGEHEADAKIAHTHCHILIAGLKVTREGLRKQIQKYSPGKGQNCTMAKTQEEPRVPYDEELLMDYIIKGNSQQVKSTSYDDAKVTTAAAAWITHEPAVSSTPINNEGVATTVNKKKKSNKYEDCHEILDQYFTKSDQNPNVELDSKTPQGRRQIYEAIGLWSNAKRKAMTTYQAADYYDIIIQQAVPDHYMNLVADIINHRHRWSHKDA